MPQQAFEDGQFMRVCYNRVPASQGVTIATILLHPLPVNTLSGRGLDELAGTLGQLERLDEVKAVVIGARSPGHFVAGADPHELLQGIGTLSEARTLADKAQSTFTRIEAMDKPVIAAIDGAALGGGCELAMACHYRIGNARTRLGQPGIRLFLPPGFGGTQRLPRLVEAALADTLASTSIALGWLLSGRAIAADIAKDGGLLDEVVTGSTDVLSRARLLAAQCARGTDNPVAETMFFRRRQREGWDAPEVLDWAEVEQDPYLTECLEQACRSGRGKVAEAIVDLVRIGLEQGIEAGLEAEAEVFARFVMDAEHGGRKGIRLFLEKRSPALPLRRQPRFSDVEIRRLENEYCLLPIGSPFVPGVTPLPQVQYAWAAVKDPASGAPDLGEPRAKERQVMVEVPQPGPIEALLYVLASELSFNDVWALTGVPVSVFDLHDEDEHVTGSGGLGLVVALGEAVQAEGRIQVGDVVAVYPGRSELLDPQAGTEPMFTRFANQGYDTPDGSHQQFMLAQGPQCLALPVGVSLEAAGSFLLVAGTVYRCLFNALNIQSGRRMLVEGAASGSGNWAVRLGLAFGVRTTGLVSTEARAQVVRGLGAGTVNRKADTLEGCFTPVPADPAHWDKWQARGANWLAAVREGNEQELVDYAVSHAGENIFPRSFQALAEGGTIAIHGASGGYHMTFLGKPGAADPAEMLQRAGLRPGESVVLYYGVEGEEQDQTGLSLLEAVRGSRGRIAVITRSDAQREFVLSLGCGEAIAGAVSIETLGRQEPAFLWCEALPELPDSFRENAHFREVLQTYAQRTFKPLVRAIAPLLGSTGNPRGIPDLVIERAGQDTLALSAMLVRPHAGRIVYCEDMAGRRYSFYAPQIWNHQRRILMPTARIVGTHLCNAAEAEAVRRLVEAGTVEIPPVHLFDWSECPEVHQAIWENRLPELTGGASKAMLNHALPDAEIRSADELMLRWGG